MTVYTTLEGCSPCPCVLALGCFDGVHLGHAAVIKEAERVANSLALPLAVWSFREPPRNFFSKNTVPLLTTPEEKGAIIATMGAHTLYSLPFDATIAAMSAEDFFSLLCEDLSAKHIVCGFNFTFGAMGRGNTVLLQSLCAQNGVGLSVLPPTTLDGETVSSSRIRACLEKGKPEEAARLLGRPYALCAEVIHGQHLARDLGFRTANQCFPEGKAVPRYGVYAVRAHADGAVCYGIANVGMRPTVRGTLLCCETHLFDFSGDLYGKTLTVEFLHFLRPEQAFDSLDALTAQVKRDIETAKSLLK